MSFRLEPAGSPAVEQGGLCLANRAAGLTLPASFSWMEDVDGDGRDEVILWDDLPIASAAGGSTCRALLPLVYQVGPAHLHRSGRTGAALYERLARTYAAMAGDRQPALQAVAAALASYGAMFRAPAVHLPAFSADRGEVASHAFIGDAMGMSEEVVIAALGEDAATRGVAVFLGPGTEDPVNHDDELTEYLARGGFVSFPVGSLQEGASHLDLAGVAVRIVGKGRRVMVSASRAGVPIGARTYRGRRPSWIGLVGGARPFLVVSAGSSLRVPLAAGTGPEL